ncbi:hypothetical protein BDW74DRAFT_181086 [Aspergillus multicolor]|uniref:uncharacterized protein n=1 Tax=Aspergillus multicolor TaxID=41759 RepID=UPI003CCD99F3
MASPTEVKMQTIYLMTSRSSSRQRAHFTIFVPSAASSTNTQADTDKSTGVGNQTGTLINVVSAPMLSFMHEFKQRYTPALHSRQPFEIHPLGETDTTPTNTLEFAALRIPAPGVSENFLAPANDTTNRRCQEWTTDYIRHLVNMGYLDAEALEIVQSKRDPPSHGIGLLPVSGPASERNLAAA